MSEAVAIAAESQDELPPRPVEVFVGSGLALTALQPEGRVGAGVVVRPSDVFAVQLEGGVAPRVEEGFVDPFYRYSRVNIDVSQVVSFASAQFQFTPVHGSFWTRRGQAHRFELSYGVGFGVVRTVDDLKRLQCPGDPLCEASKNQRHPTTTFGAGLRLWLSDRTALRIDLASTRYIENIAVSELDLRDVVTVSAGVSVAFPRGHTELVDPDSEPPESPVQVPRRDLGDGLFVRADLGAAAWLGRYGPTSDGSILRPGLAARAGFGGERRVRRLRGSLSWEVDFATGIHDGNGDPAPGAALQGDTHTYAGLVLGGYARQVAPSLGLGLRVGGGVMGAPLLKSRIGSETADYFPGFEPEPLTAHETIHPQFTAGPVVEVQTSREGFRVGLNADFVYAAGFDYGVSAGGFARVTLR